MELNTYEYFIIHNKAKPAGKSPRGGGNLSVPILINTALDFVSGLYTGKTDYMELHIPSNEDLIQDLEMGKISKDLETMFEIRKFPLPEKSEVKTIKKYKTWEIKDAETGNQYYFVNIKKNELVFHYLDKSEWNSTENAKKFILRYFPKEYKNIRALLWEGIRNGLIHTFSPKFFEYKGRYIRFQFYVEDQNVPSHIEQDKVYLFSVDENLEADLNSGIVPKDLDTKFKITNFHPDAVRKKKTHWEITGNEDDTFSFYVLEKGDKKKINVYAPVLKIRLNVFELYRVLEKAVDAYSDDLKNKPNLQNKFIRAWSSIEENSLRLIKDDSDYQRNTKALRDYLRQNTSALLLKDLNDHLNVDILKIYSLKIRRS